MLNIDNFDFFSGRLGFIDVTDDPMLNIELWHALGAFETHVYGVALQYNRIRSDLVMQPSEVTSTGRRNAGLDIYYYILTWDKVKKLSEAIRSIINRVRKSNPNFPNAFWPDFRLMGTRLDHLFSEFDDAARNEYEHPSLAPRKVGNMIITGDITGDAAGNITAHVAANIFVTVKVDHYNKLQELRTELFDVFLKHFSKKPLTKELIKARNHIEENVESYAAELKKLRDEHNTAGFNALLHRLVMVELNIGSEGVHLSESARKRIFSVLTDRPSENT